MASGKRRRVLLGHLSLLAELPDSHISCRRGPLSPHEGCRPGTACRDPMPEPSEGLAAQEWGVCGWRGCNGGTTSPRVDANGSRSEEHTSELQSLMRISYAVFCLKKKKTKQIPKPSAQL